MLRAQTSKSFKTNCFDAIMKGDIYSQKAYLSINGKAKVHSLLGFLATMTVVFSLIGFGIYKGLILIKQTQFETQMSSILRPINYTDPEIVQMNEYGLDFAFQTTISLTPDIGELVVLHQKAEQIYDEQLQRKFRVQTLTNIEVEKCSLESFNHSDIEESKVKQIDWYFCIKDRSKMRMGGSYNADLYEAIVIKLRPCLNETSNNTCKAQSEIDNYFSNVWLLFRIVDFYFDKDNNDQPVQSYINDQIYFGINIEERINHDLKIKLSKAIYDDSINPFNVQKEVEFPQVEDLQSAPIHRKQNEEYLSIALKLNYFSNLYQKKLYSITDFFSELGGLFNTLYGCGKFVMFLFIDQYFLKTVINSLFSYTSIQQNQDVQTSQISFEQQTDCAQESNFLKQIGVETMRRRIMNLDKYDCCFFKRFCTKDTTYKQQMQLYQIGKRKLRYDLDIVALLRMMQEFYIIKQLLLTKNQRKLLKWQRKLTLCVDDLHNLHSEKRLRKQFARSNAEINPISKMAEFEKLKQVLFQISDGDLTTMNQKLLNGIIGQDFSEEKSIGLTQKKKAKSNSPRKTPHSKGKSRRHKISPNEFGEEQDKSLFKETDQLFLRSNMSSLRKHSRYHKKSS